MRSVVITLFFVTVLTVPEALAQAFAKPQTSYRPDCKQNALVVPPVVNDPHLADWLTQEALSAAGKKGFLKCLRIIDTPKTRDVLSYVGYSSYRTTNVKKFHDKQLSYFMDDHKLSRIIFLRYQEGENPSVAAKVYRIDLNEDEDYYTTLIQKFTVAIDEEEKAGNESPLWRRYIPFFAPNAIAFGSTFTSVSMQTDETYREIGEEQKTRLPAFLSSFSLSRMAHPDSFNNWDLSFDISPRLMFFALDQITTIRKVPVTDNPAAEGLDTQRLKIIVNGGCGTLDGTVSFFSWIGTTYISLGLGPCLYGVQQETDLMKINGDLGTRGTFGHTVFLTKSVYVNLDISIMSFRKHLYHNEFAKSSSVTRTGLAIGYFFPDAERTLLRLFGG